MLAVNGLYILAVHPAVSAKSVSDLIALAKASPGKLNASIAGAGTPTHLGLEQYKAMAGVSIAAINYKGAAPAATGLLSGETQIMFVSMPMVISQAQAGKLRALAGTGASHIDGINGELRKVLAQPDVKERMLTLGAEIVASSPQEFGAFMKSEIAKWGKVVREAWIKAE